MGDLTDPQPTPPTSSPAPRLAPTTNPRPPPVRDDCWTEDATFTLISAWGKHFLHLNKGNLRQKHWQDVSDSVNARHAELGDKVRRSDVQCKNRIDTLKKKYKIEKARVSDSRGSYTSPWPFFSPLDSLIGSVAPSQSAVKKPNSAPPMAVPLLPHRGPGLAVATVVPQKRNLDFRKDYSSLAAAAAAAVSEDEEEEEEEEEVEEVRGKGEGEGEGMRRLAGAIDRFAEVYARVETEKQRQLVELEKQRMEFAKELECQRMQMLVEMQVQIEKVKRMKH